MKVNFADGIREELVRLGLLSEWDKCSECSREEHDEQVRKKYNRPTEKERLDKIFNR